MGILTNFLKLLKPEPNDFVDVAKHISENYDKLDQNAKSNNETLTNLSNNKLDKGTYSGNASNLKSEIDGKVSKSGDTMTGALTISASKYPGIIFNGPDIAAVGYSVENEYTYIKAGTGTGLRIYSDNTVTLQANNLNTKNKEVVAAINENYEKFKNFCPFPINSIFLTLGTENPATLFLVTTWEKQEGRFLLGSNSAYTLGSTGGSSTTTLSKENLPNVKLQIDSFSLGKGTQEITGDFYTSNYIGYAGSEAFYRKQSGLGGHGGDSSSGNKIGFQASKSWTGMSTSAAPYTANMGDSTPFNNMPPYLVVNIWKRLS